MLHGKSRSNCGLTMVEVTVVVAITTILCGLLYTGVTRARQQAQTVACMNNLKQIATALMMYEERYGAIVLPKETLPSALAEFVTDEAIFICPAGNGQTTDSYSRYYVARPATLSNGFLLGCPNHGDGSSAGAFGLARATRGNIQIVTWNGQPVPVGAEIQGGVLRFAEGTEVLIEPNLKVVVLASFDKGAGKIYSAIRIPDGSFGSLTVNAAHGTHFDVATPTCTAGVRGTKFSVATSQATDENLTTIHVYEGIVAVHDHSRHSAIRNLRAGDECVFKLPKTGIPPSDLPVVKSPQTPPTTITGPFFANNVVSWNITNNTSSSMTINLLTLNVPIFGNWIKEIHLGARVIYNSNILASLISISSGWNGPATNRQIPPGQTKTLSLIFERTASTDSSSYSIDLKFTTPPPQNL